MFVFGLAEMELVLLTAYFVALCFELGVDNTPT